MRRDATVTHLGKGVPMLSVRFHVCVAAALLAAPLALSSGRLAMAGPFITDTSPIGQSTSTDVIIRGKKGDSFTIAYIGSDEQRAREWIEHEDPTRSFMGVRTMTKEGLAKLGTPDPDAQASVEYKVYRQLCMGKHSNPLLQKR